MQLLSLPLMLDPGFVIHLSKHFVLIVCMKKEKIIQKMSKKVKYKLQKEIKLEAIL